MKYQGDGDFPITGAERNQLRGSLSYKRNWARSRRTVNNELERRHKPRCPVIRDSVMEEKIVEISKLRTSNGEQTLADAIVNVKDGLPPKTTGPVLLTEEEDGTYSIGDGFHRIARAILKGDKFILADIRCPVTND